MCVLRVARGREVGDPPCVYEDQLMNAVPPLVKDATGARR